MKKLHILKRTSFVSLLLTCTFISVHGITYKYRNNTQYQSNKDSTNSCGALTSTAFEEDPCYVNDTIQKCPETSPSGAVITKRCRMFYTFDNVQKTSYVCLSGRWIAVDRQCKPECGIKRVTGETTIISGSIAEAHEYPWVVAIYNSINGFICSGTIISQSHVLSAAHCFAEAETGASKDFSEFTIIAGKHYRSIETQDPFSQTRKVKNLWIHEDYRGYILQYNNDIAVAKISEEFTFSLEVEPICIDWKSVYENVALKNGNEGEIAGWGLTEETGKPSDVLHKLSVPYKDTEECWQHLPNDFRLKHLTSDKFCAGYLNRSIGICKGDSGGGLYFESDNRFYIRGIASLTVRAKTMCSSNHYSLYTRVSKFLEWINMKIN